MQDNGDVIRWLMTMLIGAVLVLVTLNAFQDEHEMHAHHGFFKEVRAFMNRGGRNTEQQGYDLCKRINELEKGTRLKLHDCEKIYPTADHDD